MEALKGVRILDMTHVQAGPTCSQLLAWMGADVIKFENPAGDATRGQLRDVPNADSLYFTMLNCNKRSITVNMKSAEGKQVFVDLLKKWDYRWAADSVAESVAIESRMPRSRAFTYTSSKSSTSKAR